MFSSLSQRLGTRMLDRLDLLVELATLGGYGLDEDGVFALESAAPDGLMRALAFSGEGVVAAARAGARAPAGLAWGERPREDCRFAGTLSPPCRDGAARP